VLNAEQKER